MGALDKFIEVLKIDNGDDGYYDEDEYEEVAEKESKQSSYKDDVDKEPASKKNSTIPSRPQNSKNVRKNNFGMEVVRVEPSSVEDGRKISNFLLENKVVFLDLEGIDMNLAQRIIDFVSGATYAIDGTLQQMSKFTFVIAPSVVNVSGDFQDSVSSTSVTF